MEEYIEREETERRKQKQLYLRTNILETGYDPEKFLHFISNERLQGENVDNWTLEELETLVAVFKRTCKDKDPETLLAYQLEDIELEDKEEFVYARLVNTELKKKTLFFDKSPFVIIESLQVIEGGIFSSRTVSFTIAVSSEGLKVVRLKSDFKWLYQILALEFPFIPLPPLMNFHDKTY